MDRKIVVVEDEPLTRGLLEATLRGAGFDALGAANAAEAIRLCREHDPDALVVDIELGAGPTGLDLVDSLLPANPHLGVVFLSRVPDARFVDAAAPRPRSTIAWLRKQDLARPQELLDALDAVLRGSAGAHLRRDLDADRPLAGLSRAQVALLRLVAEGLSNEEIAAQRKTSVRAVERLVTRTFAAAGVRDDDGGGNARVMAVRLIATQAALPG